jgi:hypothetical protein
VKKITGLLAALSLLIVLFASCEKDYTCYCYVDYTVDTVGNGEFHSVYHTDNKFSIHGVKDDAEKECRYYQVDTIYLQQRALVDHHCKLVD